MLRYPRNETHPMPERFAIYFAPDLTSPLWRLARQWLGRDAATDETVEAIVSGIKTAQRLAATASARRYGFHATLKAPMTLAGGATRATLEAALADWAAVHASVNMGPMVLRPIGAFLALVPDVQSAALMQFAADCVVAFERFRAPLAARDRSRRVAGELSAHQIELLERYGYPYVMDEFRLHMTVSDQLYGAEHDLVRQAAQNWFAPMIGKELLLDRLTLFHEAEPGAAFRRVADFPLSGTQRG